MLQKALKKNVIRKFRWLNAEDQELIQELQQANQCCGITYRGYQDYRSIDEVPSSCCQKYDEDRRPDNVGLCQPLELKPVKGCGPLMVNLFRKRLMDNFFRDNAVRALYCFQTLTIGLSLLLAKLFYSKNKRIVLQDSQHCLISKQSQPDCV